MSNKQNDIIRESITDEMTEYGVNNPDATTEEIAQKFKVDTNWAFYCVQEAGKKLGKIDQPYEI